MSENKRKGKTPQPSPNGSPAKPMHPLARCTPRGDRVVVLRDRARKETGGGIIVPDSVDNGNQQMGTVVSVGPGRKSEDGFLVPIDLKPDDRVILTGYAGLEIRDNLGSHQDQDYVILREEDIVAVLPKDEAADKAA